MVCAYAIFSSEAYPALQNFSALPHKWHDFILKKAIEYKMCVSSFFTTFAFNIFRSKKKLAR
jgi:hypothetical protein